MARGRRKKIPADHVAIIQACNLLTDEEKQILTLIAEDVEKPYEKLGMSQSTFYKKLSSAWEKYRQCLETLSGTTPEQEQGEEQEALEEKEEKPRTRSTKPEKAMERRALQVLTRLGVKKIDELIKTQLAIGQYTYEKFYYIQLFTGKPWEQIIDEAYEAYMEKHDLEADMLTSLLDDLLLDRIAEELEELEEEKED